MGIWHQCCKCVFVSCVSRGFLGSHAGANWFAVYICITKFARPNFGVNWDWVTSHELPLHLQ
jgi:hypothetical protein